MDLKELVTKIGGVGITDQNQWDFSNLLGDVGTIYGTGLAIDNTSGLVDCLNAKWPGRLKKHTVVDVMHGSDECCCVEILTLDGNPVLLHRAIGDHGDYSHGLHVLDHDFAKQALFAAIMFNAEQQMQDCEVEVPENVFETVDDLLESTQYLRCLGAGYFTVNSPRWALGFKDMLFKHMAYWFDENGQWQRVVTIGKWKDPSASSYSDDAADVEIGLEDGQNFYGSAKDIVFCVAGHNTAQLDVLGKEVAKDNYWFAQEPASRFKDIPTLVIVKHTKGRLHKNRCYFEAESVQERDDFVAAHSTAQFSKPAPVAKSRVKAPKSQEA